MKEQWCFFIWDSNKLIWQPCTSVLGKMKLFDTLSEIDDYVNLELTDCTVIKIEKVHTVIIH